MPPLLLLAWAPVLAGVGAGRGGRTRTVLGVPTLPVSPVLFPASPLSLAAHPPACARCPAGSCGWLSGTPLRWLWNEMLSWRDRRCPTSLSGGDEASLASSSLYLENHLCKTRNNGPILSLLPSLHQNMLCFHCFFCPRVVLQEHDTLTLNIRGAT